MDLGEITALSSRVAQELTTRTGEGWVATAGFNSGQRKLMGPNGAELFISEKQGRVRVAGTAPATSMHIEAFECSTAASRGAAAIAANVVQRVLPGYLAQLAAVLKYNATAQANHDARRAYLRDIAGLFGDTFKGEDWEPRGSRGMDTLHIPGRGNGRVEVCAAPDTATLTLNYVPADVAREILALYAARLSERPATR
jgi:hypothetical protein